MINRANLNGLETKVTNEQMERIIKKINSVPDVYNTATFEEMKRSMVEWLSSQDEFKDVNFLGSRINVLIDILTYNMLFIQQFSNSALFESFLQTAMLRSSVVQHAQDSGYFTSGKSAAYTEIMIKCSHLLNQTSLRIPKNTKFLATSLQRPTAPVPFITIEDTTVIRDEDGYYYPIMRVYQGRLIRHEFRFDPNHRLSISDKNIDRNKVRVWVDNAEWVDWTRKPMVDITGTSHVFYMREDIDGNTEIFFGEGKQTTAVSGGAIESNYIGGLKPVGGASIIVEYLRTDGELGNSAINFTYADTKPNIVVHEVIENPTGAQDYMGASGGGNEESIERIREQAVLKRETQNRCVTNNDYEVFVMERFGSIIQAIKAFHDKEKPGYVFIATKPRDGLYLTPVQREDIKNYLMGYNISSITPVPMSPDYLFIKQKIKIAYDMNTLEGTEQWLHNKVIDKIDEYYTNDVEAFDRSFHKSRLLSYVDKADISVLGSTAEIELARELSSYMFTPMAGVNFHNRVVDGSVLSSPIEYIPILPNGILDEGSAHNIRIISTKLPVDAKMNQTVGKILLGPFKEGEITSTIKPYTSTDFDKPKEHNNEYKLYYEIGSIDYALDYINWSFEVLGLSSKSFLAPSIDLYAKPIEDNIFVKQSSLIVFENTLRPEYTEITMEAIAQ